MCVTPGAPIARTYSSLRLPTFSSSRSPSPRRNGTTWKLELIDQPGGAVLLDDVGASSEQHIHAARGSPRLFERGLDPFGDECEGGASLHLQRLTGMMGEHEDRRVERRVVTPPALPRRVVVPPGVAELPRAHDLGPDPRIVEPHEGVVDAAAAAGLADQLVPPPGLEQPLVQPVAGVTEGGLAGQAFAGAEPVERDGEELDAGE